MMVILSWRWMDVSVDVRLADVSFIDEQEVGSADAADLETDADRNSAACAPRGSAPSRNSRRHAARQPMPGPRHGPAPRPSRRQSPPIGRSDMSPTRTVHRSPKASRWCRCKPNVPPNRAAIRPPNHAGGKPGRNRRLLPSRRKAEDRSGNIERHHRLAAALNPPTPDPCRCHIVPDPARKLAAARWCSASGAGAFGNRRRRRRHGLCNTHGRRYARLIVIIMIVNDHLVRAPDDHHRGQCRQSCQSPCQRLSQQHSTSV